MKRIILCGVLLFTAAAFSASPAVEPIEADAQVSSGVHMSATLETFGSFGWRAAPSYTRLATVRRATANDLRNGRISVARAEEIQRRADHVRSLLDRAKAACRQDDRTAKCNGDQLAAERLLDEANRVLARIFD